MFKVGDKVKYRVPESDDEQGLYIAMFISDDLLSCIVENNEDVVRIDCPDGETVFDVFVLVSERPYTKHGWVALPTNFSKYT